jgi:prefoldin subunit 5
MRAEESMKKSDETLNAKFASLAESQMRTEEAVRRLSERGEKTDEAVRKLTEAVNDHLRDYRNGERDVSRE